jgi:hypothetical protein
LGVEANGPPHATFNPTSDIRPRERQRLQEDVSEKYEPGHEQAVNGSPPGSTQQTFDDPQCRERQDNALKECFWQWSVRSVSDGGQSNER